MTPGSGPYSQRTRFPLSAGHQISFTITFADEVVGDRYTTRQTAPETLNDVGNVITDLGVLFTVS